MGTVCMIQWHWYTHLTNFFGKFKWHLWDLQACRPRIASKKKKIISNKHGKNVKSLKNWVSPSNMFISFSRTANEKEIIPINNIYKIKKKMFSIEYLKVSCVKEIYSWSRKSKSLSLVSSQLNSRKCCKYDNTF